MRQINGYWVDANSNRWACSYYTAEQAEEYSATLINCLDCRNCQDCQDCQDCRDCWYCRNCWNCWYCRNCWNCRGCGDCKNYQDNPQRYVTPCIGSRNDNTTIYWLDGNVQVVCGCFRGNLDEFETRVREVHGDSEHGRAYMAEIAKVRALMQ